jgi:hypothetical protein
VSGSDKVSTIQMRLSSLLDFSKEHSNSGIVMM